MTVSASPTFNVYVLNLDRDAERLSHMREQLEHLGLPWVRVPGVLGSSLDAGTLNQSLDRQAFERTHGMPPVLGEVGCYLSHLKAQQVFLESEHDFAIILEDDVVLGDKLPAAIEQLINCQDAWDMVKLSRIHSGTPVKCRDLGDGQSLAIMLSQCTGASAYMINRRAAQVYLSKLMPMTLPYDHAYDRSWALGIKVRLVTPTPCNHDYSFGTTIITHGQQRKFKWYRRFPAFGYRISNELSRVTWALGQVLLSKLHLAR